MLSGQEVLRLLIARREEVVLAPMMVEKRADRVACGSAAGVCCAGPVAVHVCAYYFRHDDHLKVQKKLQSTLMRCTERRTERHIQRHENVVRSFRPRCDMRFEVASHVISRSTDLAGKSKRQARRGTNFRRPTSPT